MVRKPVVHEKKPLDSRKVLVAHGRPEVVSRIQALLGDRGYAIITSQDGIDAMVKTLKELPFLMIVDVALPKIYGFELCKRLKGRDETRDIKCLLIGSIHDKSKYRREPASLYGADEYIEEHNLTDALIEKIDALHAGSEGQGVPGPPEPERPAPPAAEKPAERPVEKPAERPAVKPAERPAPAAAQPSAQAAPVIPGMPAPGSGDEKVEKAKRLSRTIINDIYLYNTAKVDEAIKKDTFRSVFAAEIREGMKLYEQRIPAEIRSKGDYFNEAINNFIAAKK